MADVVSVDSWYASNGNDSVNVDLHADVVFRTAKITGGLISPVRFQLALRRAEVVIVVHPNEPITIIKSSVSRDEPDVSGHKTSKVTDESRRVGSGQIILSTRKPNVTAAAVELGYKSGKQSVSSTEYVQPIKSILSQQSKTKDGSYRWELTPGIGSVLEGRGWDAKLEPRMSLAKRDHLSKISACISLEVRCKREDIVISDITITDGSTMSRLKNAVGHSNRLAAAEAYIRHCLIREGLKFESLEDPYSEICIADLVVVEEDR